MSKMVANLLAINDLQQQIQRRLIRRLKHFSGRYELLESGQIGWLAELA